MLVVLEAVAGPIAGRRIEIHSGSILRLGRTARSDYAIGEDSYLSGQHFAVECDGTQARVRDLGSSNGTFVNGDKITEIVVREGDSLMAGESTFTIHIDLSVVAKSGPSSGTVTVPTLAYTATRARLEQTAAIGAGGAQSEWEGFSRSQGALLSALYQGTDHIYALLDPTRDSRIPAFLEAGGQPCTTLDAEGRAIAYLVSLPPHARLLDVLIKDGWSRGWGFYFSSAASLEQVSAHWRRYMFLYTADQRRLTFRFWDPRVLRSLAPLMSAQEAAEFFGPVNRMIVESEKPEIAVEISATPRGGRQQTLVLI